MTWLRLIVRDFRFHPILWGLSLVGIAMGVGGWIGMESATYQAMQAFHQSMKSTLGNSTHVVEPRGDHLDQEVYFDLAKKLSSPITPVLETHAQRITDRDGLEEPSEQVRVMGIDSFSYGRFQSARSSPDFPAEAMVSGDPVAVPTRDLRNISGDTIVLRTDSDPVHYRLNGQFPDSGVVSTIWIDVGRFQLDFQHQNELSRVMLKLDQESVQTVRDIVGDRGLVLPRGDRTRSVRSMIAAFRWNLRALSFLALFVGAFLVYSAMFLYATRQRRMISLLRTLGVSRNEIAITLFGALSIMGVVGSFLGIGVGIFMAGPMGSLIRGTVDQLYTPIFAQQSGLGPRTAFLGWGLGFAMSLLGGVGPLWTQLRTPYRAWEQREITGEQPAFNPTYLGLFVFFSWIVAGLLVLGSDQILFGFLACFFLALGGSLAGPLVVSMYSDQWIPGQWLRLAVRNIRYHRSTTGIMVAVLIAAFSMVFSVDVLVDSFRGSVNQWVDRVVRADYYIRSAPGPETRKKPPLSDQFLRTIESQLGDHGVISRLYEQKLFTKQGNPITLRGIDPDKLQGRLEFQFNQTLAEPWSELRRGRMWLSEPGAYRMEQRPGDTVPYPSVGNQALTIGAIYNEYGTEWASGYLSIEKFQTIFPDVRPHSVALFVDDEVTKKDVASWAEQYGYVWESQQNLRRRAMKQFDRTFAVTDLMKVLAVLIAGVGLFILLLSFVEMRTKLFGRLSAIGVNRFELIRMVSWEALLVALSAFLVAIPTGLLLSSVLIYVINRRSFGWLIPMELSSAPFYTLMGLIGATIVLSVLGPIYRLSSQPISRWLREEGQ